MGTEQICAWISGILCWAGLLAASFRVLCHLDNLNAGCGLELCLVFDLIYFGYKCEIFEEFCVLGRSSIAVKVGEIMIIELMHLDSSHSISL